MSNHRGEQRRRRASPVGAGRITVSFRPAIPWRVAPQQSPLPLRRPRQSTSTLDGAAINTGVVILSHHGGPSAARATSTQLATAAPLRANLPRQNTKAGTHVPAARATERWTPAFTGEALDIVCRHALVDAGLRPDTGGPLPKPDHH